MGDHQRIPGVVCFDPLYSFTFYFLCLVCLFRVLRKKENLGLLARVCVTGVLPCPEVRGQVSGIACLVSPLGRLFVVVVVVVVGFIVTTFAQ